MQNQTGFKLGWNTFLLIACLTTLTACGGAAAETLTPEEIITRSAATMRALPGFHFNLSRTGAPAFLDAFGTLAFREADGNFVSPDKVRATVKVIAPGIVAEVAIIGIGDQEWETNIFTGNWELVPPEYAFKPSILFDPNAGIQLALIENLEDPVLLGTEELEEVPGLALYHLQGKMSGADIQSITLGLIDPESLNVDIWIAPGSFELYRVVLVDPALGDETESTTWQMDFWDFGTVIDISPPI